MKQSKTQLRKIASDHSGAIAVEFAIALPFLLGIGLYGAETANMAYAHMKVGQLAIHLADNASRIGDTSNLASRKIYESDINDLIVGSNMQSNGLDFYNRGRAIISSLEVNPSGQQYIHWQRCKGIKNATSAFGGEGSVVTNGMGPSGEEVAAIPGGAVIFVEVTYDYKPLVSNKFFGPTTIQTAESFMVRNNRDLTGAGLFQRNPSQPDPVASCSTYSTVPNTVL